MKEKTKETWLVGKNKLAQVSTYKSHQSLVGAAIELQPPSVDWPRVKWMRI